MNIGNGIPVTQKRVNKFIATMLVVTALLSLSAGMVIYQTGSLIPKMFKLAGNLKAEGYYMGEFEFKMIGIIYYLDKGEYLTAFSHLHRLHSQLSTKDGLIKVPSFADKRAELEFYYSLQNPKTGAFMDDTYPPCTFVGPTLNVINHMTALAAETGQPLQLKYPLRFLDQINTGDKLRAYLDDLATVGWLASKLPKTQNILAFEILYYRDIEDCHLYSFTPEWKHALLQWFYDNQDSETGGWGPRLRSSGVLLDPGDDSNYHVARWFVDDQGQDRNPEFPLKYKDKLFATTLKKLSSSPLPADFASQHAWVLSQDRGIKVLANLLWNSASPEDKSRAQKCMEEHIKLVFQKFFVKDQGAFSLYAESTQADLDGTGLVFSMLQTIGAFSKERQEKLWGPMSKTCVDLGTHNTTVLKPNDFAEIAENPSISSLRIYRSAPSSGDLLSNVVCIYYPKETPILDVLDLLPKLARWGETTSQSMGNWVSKESLMQDLSKITTQPVPVYIGNIPVDRSTEIIQNSQELTIIGFDMLQIPRYKMRIRLVY